MCYERRDPNVARECWERDQSGKKMAEYRKVDGFPYSVTSDGVVRNDKTGHLLKEDT